MITKCFKHKTVPMDIDDFLRDTRYNTLISWFLISLIGLVFFESVLDLDILWILFSGLTFFLAVLPALAYRDYEVMPPFEVLLLASIPVIVRSFNLSVLSGEISTYISIAAVALLLAVELHIFTEIKLSHGFAIGLTVISTLAIGGIWSIIRFILDTQFGTGFLTTNEALMKEYISVLTAGIFAGLLFDSYFRRRDKVFRRKVMKVIKR